MVSNITQKLWNAFVTAYNFTGISYLFMFHKSFLSYLTDWFHWGSTAVNFLEQAEEKLLCYIQKPIELQFLKIQPFGQVKEECSIRTLIINKESKNSPLVLLHGFASGIGFWLLNLESLSKTRTVYAIDLLGFGRSSRPPFSKDPELAEDQFVESIEQWRKQIQLNRFILLGHSMGGFLAAAYAIKYPDRVKHLILADPWGFPEPDLSVKKIEVPVWIKIISCMLRPFNPLAGLRAAGHSWGPNLVKRLRPDLVGKFECAVEDSSVISNYIYYCNAQTPSGESAFKAMTSQYGWAKRPMLKRISELRSDVSVTFIYGSKSWIDSYSGVQCASLRPNSSVEVKVIQGAGHHVYADKATEFNKLVNCICDEVDFDESLSISSKKKLCEVTTDESNSDSVDDLSDTKLQDMRFPSC